MRILIYTKTVNKINFVKLLQKPFTIQLLMQNIIGHIKICVPRTQIPHTDCKILNKLFFVKLLLSAFNIQALSAFTRSGPVPYDHY